MSIILFLLGILLFSWIYLNFKSSDFPINTRSLLSNWETIRAKGAALLEEMEQQRREKGLPKFENNEPESVKRFYARFVNIPGLTNI